MCGKCLLTVLIISVSSLMRAEIYYIATNGDDARSGKGAWTNALLTISNGVAKATSYMDTVLVSNGNYNLTSEIKVQTPILIRGYNGKNSTFVNGNYPSTTNRCFSIGHSNAIADGFTISNGCSDSAGGVNITNGLICNCLISACAASNIAGGIYASGAGSVVSNCTISCNNVNNNGAGAYLSGGAQIYNSIIRNNRMGTNAGTTAFGGAGLYLSSSLAKNCIVISNEGSAAAGFGFGCCLNVAGLLQNCKVMYNSGSYGAVYVALSTVDCCTIVQNVSTQSNVGGVKLANDGGGELRNSIVYFNYGGLKTNWSGGTLTNKIANCCTAPLAVAGDPNQHLSGDSVNNVSSSPQFVSTSSDNYNLTRESPCINTGANQDWMTNGAVDLDGHSRIDRFSGIVDMGCYEYLPQGTMYSVP